MVRRLVPFAVVWLGIVLLMVAGVLPQAQTPWAFAAEGDAVKRGEYLVTVGGCGDCHTPWKMGSKGPEPDGSRMLSGHQNGELTAPKGIPEGPWSWAATGSMTAFAGPWGISYAANLTPHKTGLGGWTEKEFVEAMRTGKHMGQGRPILPPMPWFNLGKATEEDLKAIFAYLRSIPPLENRVPAPKVTPPPKR